MKLQGRTFNEGLPDESKVLCLICETEEESQIVDNYLGKNVPFIVQGEVRLSDGYGEHYILLKNC